MGADIPRGKGGAEEIGYLSKANHGYEPQSKLWKHIPQQASGYYTPQMQDNSTNKLQCTSLLKFESHYPPLRGIVQLTNSAALAELEFHNKSKNQALILVGKKQLFF